MLTWQVNLIAQVVLLVIQILVPAFAPFNADQKIAIAAFVSSVQGVLAMYAHNRNTDGTKLPPPPSRPTIQGGN